MEKRHINIKLKGSTWEKVKAIKGGRTITQFFEDLIDEKVGREKEEAGRFIELMQKIDGSDVSKIAAEVKAISTKMDEMRLLVWREKEGKPDGSSAIDYLDATYQRVFEIFKITKSKEAK